MSIAQKFYDSLAKHYDKLFLDWEEESRGQALIIQKLFNECGYNKSSKILDCACGIGTQAIGLAKLGYNITASDFSERELEEANRRAGRAKVDIPFKNADFCELTKTFDEKFDIVIAIDNALPHMLTKDDLALAVKSIVCQIKYDGIFIGSIRDYDAILKDKPTYSPPYIHKTKFGQRVAFQTWDWRGDIYKFTQYIIEDEQSLRVNKFECEYRAIRREELTELFYSCGCKEVCWKFSEETAFYQPIIIAKK